MFPLSIPDPGNSLPLRRRSYVKELFESGSTLTLDLLAIAPYDRLLHCIEI